MKFKHKQPGGRPGYDDRRASADNFEQIAKILNGGLGPDNFGGTVLDGTTNAIPDTASPIPHGLKRPPLGGIILAGDAYLAGWDETNIDVRSRQANITYKIIISD